MQSILVAFEDSQLDALVCPETIESAEEFFGHGFVGANVRGRVDHLGMALVWLATLSSGHR